MRPPPATPWMDLPMRSIFIFTAKAHMIELLIKTATAASRMSLRPQLLDVSLPRYKRVDTEYPYISENLAQIGAAAAFAMRYVPPIQVYPAAECRSDVMVGMAVETMVASRAAIKRES